MTDHIPTDIYRQCVAIAKSYYTMLRRRREQEEIILHGSPLHDGQPKAQGVGDPTARKAERLIAPRVPVRLLVKWLFPAGEKHRDGEWMTEKPDTENLNKALVDCMTQLGFWADDAQVVSEIIEKFWAKIPGVYIRVDILQEEQ